MKLTPRQLYVNFRNATFPEIESMAMGAIALRESAGEPSAFNGNAATGDFSCGLTQINVSNGPIVKLLRDHGILIGALVPVETLPGMPPSDKRIVPADYSKLFDPLVNAKAAFLIWAHNDRNLDIAWYINHTNGNYKAAYESHLPAMMAAALGF